MKTLTYGVLPSRYQFEKAFFRLCPQMGPTYTIKHGSPGPDWRPAAGEYTVTELWAELERLVLLQRIYDACDGDATQDDSPGQWAASILSTLGFEWV